MSERHRWPLWLHHRQVPMTLAIGALVIGTNFVAHAIGEALAIVAIVGILGADFVSYRHQGTLCERCAADMPVNGEELAEKRRRLLRWHHAPIWRLLLLVAIILIPDRSPWELVGSVAVAGFLLSVAVADGAHLPVSLWCPWCSGGGGGGDDDPEEAPTPSPTDSAELSR